MRTPAPTKKLVMLLLLAVALASPSGAAPGRPALDPAPYDRVVARADWPSQGPVLTFAVLGQEGEPRGRAVAVYSDTGSGPVQVLLGRDRGFAPWAVAAAELDGDSLPEMAVAVFKPTRYDPHPDNRLFIYDFDGQNMLPLWLGSRLGLPFEDFAFAPGPDGRDRLLTVEHQGRERLALRRYSWNGFGFSHEQDLVRIQDPDDYEKSRDELIAKMKDLASKGVNP